ncbi:MAG: hypothetical protein IH984_09970 [Planctomycetes bacterium]|nr:hypothetical protein [Planctomycetota bacterium]
MRVSRQIVRRMAFSLGALALAATFSLTDAASAQLGLRGPGQGQPSFTSRDIQVAVDALQLDDTQGYIVSTLFEDYENALKDSQANLSRKIEDMREEIMAKGKSGENVLVLILKPFNEWQVENEQLADRFFDDLKSVLNEEQIKLWPSFDRRLFRLKQLKNAKLTGERLDLLVVLRELNLSEGQTEEISSLMESYEIELDNALRKREDYIKSSQGRIGPSLDGETPESIISQKERELVLRKGIRDVNERYTAEFSAALPEDLQESFVEKVQMRTFARVYRPTRGQRTIKAAKEIKGLEAENLQAIESLEVDFLVELRIINEDLVRLIKAQEPVDLLYKVKATQARSTGEKLEKPENQTNSKFSKRRDLDLRYIVMLENLLTPEQYASLPGVGIGGPASFSGIARKDNPKNRAIDASRRKKIEALRRGSRNLGTGGDESKDDSTDGS